MNSSNNSQFSGSQSVLVCLRFSFGTQGGMDKVVTREICEANDASTESLKATKRYICNAALDPLKKKASELRRRVHLLTMPWDVEGMRLCSVAHLERVIAARDTGFEELRDLKENHLKGRWFEWLEITRTQNGRRFVEAEFPTLEELDASVSWGMSLTPLTESDAIRHLNGVNSQILDELVAQNEARYAAIKKQIQKEAWEALGGPIQKIVETLTRDKPRIFDSLIGNINDIIDRLPGLNLENDPELAAIAAKAKQDLGTIDVDLLRKDVGVREQAVRKAQGILEVFGRAGARKFAQ